MRSSFRCVERRFRRASKHQPPAKAIRLGELHWTRLRPIRPISRCIVCGQKTWRELKLQNFSPWKLDSCESSYRQETLPHTLHCRCYDAALGVSKAKFRVAALRRKLGPARPSGHGEQSIACAMQVIESPLQQTLAWIADHDVPNKARWLANPDIAHADSSHLRRR